jgi:AcrR family transcriptional regulator
MSSKSRNTIIQVAKTLFGEKGFNDTSVREIAKRGKVNVAMIAYYFGCKEKLYESVLHEFALEKSKDVQDILTSPSDVQDFKNKIQDLLHKMMTSYTEDAALLKILIREMNSEKTKANKGILEMVRPFFLSVRNFFQAAIDNNILATQYSDKNSADILALLFLAVLSHPVNAEVPIKKNLGMTLHDDHFQKIYSEHLLSLFFNGVLK